MGLLKKLEDKIDKAYEESIKNCDEKTDNKIKLLVGIPIYVGVIGASIAGSLLSAYGGYHVGKLLSENSFLVKYITTTGALLIGAPVSVTASQILGSKVYMIARPIAYKILKKKK